MQDWTIRELHYTECHHRQTMFSDKQLMENIIIQLTGKLSWRDD